MKIYEFVIKVGFEGLKFLVVTIALILNSIVFTVAGIVETLKRWFKK